MLYGAPLQLLGEHCRHARFPLRSHEFTYLIACTRGHPSGMKIPVRRFMLSAD
jgi:hypothetical protein